MTNCPKAGCGAVIGADGYCSRCGTAAKPRATPQGAIPSDPTIPPVSTAPARTMPLSARSPAGSSPSTSTAFPGAPVDRSAAAARRDPLIKLPPVPAGDPLDRVLDDPQVLEHKRYCPNFRCRHEVGRGRDSRPGRPEGFCTQCGTEFSFRPPLVPGLLVGDGQFEVQGAIAHGGLGWIYLAWDRRVGHWVILKGLINPDDPDTRQVAVAELAALADAKHSNIVTVYSVVAHPHPRTGRDIDYIVMEYLDGPSLKQLRQEYLDRSACPPGTCRRTDCPTDPAGDQQSTRTCLAATGIPVEYVCGFALKVLAALGHLHDRGLLYCDLSVDNVIHSTVGVKLIDLGAVRRMDDRDSPLWGKTGYQDPNIGTQNASVATDLYTVARMMAALSFPFPGFSTYRHDQLPEPDEVELLTRHPSFARLLRRATNPDPQQRFDTAADMAEQVEGVLREVRALEEDRPFPAASTRFGPELRVVGTDPDAFPTEPLDTFAAALALPDPQVDPADPHAGLLAAISADSPDETERVLTTLPDPSLETRLRVVRARIELRHPQVGSDLDALEHQEPGDWRVDWFRGLGSLIDDDAEHAREKFTAVLNALPGEAAPKLALALCAERSEATGLAARYYETVWRTDRSYVSAAFGLARARFALGDRAGTADALEAVPENSRYGETARLCAILARDRGRTNEQALVADFFTAAERLPTLKDIDERRRELAIAEVLETALAWDEAGRPWPYRSTTPIPDTLLGHPLDQRGLRDRLESAYRKLAQLAATPQDRIMFIDRANDRRNRSWT